VNSGEHRGHSKELEEAYRAGYKKAFLEYGPYVWKDGTEEEDYQAWLKERAQT